VRGAGLNVLEMLTHSIAANLWCSAQVKSFASSRTLATFNSRIRGIFLAETTLD
jgi:hypothetical protein